MPGLGRLTWDAALERDPSLLLGATLLWALIYALGRIGAQWASTLADPRKRGAGEAA